MASGYRSAVVFTSSELEELLTGEGAVLPAKFSDWLEILSVSDAGYVTSIRVGDLTLSGTRFRSLLGLRSSCFTFTWTGRQITFEVRGYGHGAGLSQNGSDYMARQGSSCDEILAYYYPGTSVVTGL